MKLIGICENQAAWDGALERSYYYYPFITYRYGWLKTWEAGMLHQANSNGDWKRIWSSMNITNSI